MESNSLKRDVCSCSDCSESILVPLLKGEGAETEAFQVEESSSEYDESALIRGQRFFRKNFFSILVAHLIGLIAILKVNSIRQVLKLTGKSSDSKVAFERYFDTIIHLKNWYETSLFHRDSRAFLSLEDVRRKHRAASRLSSTRLSYAITQTDMALTQWAFVAPVLLQPRRLGIAVSSVSQEVDGFVHFWKVVGRLLGLQERFNICRGGTAVETERECRAVLHAFVQPAIADFPRLDSDHMAHSIIRGLSACLPGLHPEAFHAFSLHVLLESLLVVPQSKSQSPNKWQFTANVWLLENAFNVPFLGAILRVIFNHLLRLALFLKQTLDHESKGATEPLKKLVKWMINVLKRTKSS